MTASADTPGTMAADLAARVDELRLRIAQLSAAADAQLAPGGGPMPEPRPREDETLETWRDRVAIARARHDASALDAGLWFDGVIAGELGPDALGAASLRLHTQWAEIDVVGGTVGLKIYTPASDGPHPAIALVHGGAYWMGGGAAGWRLNDALSRKLAGELQAVVVVIDHRMAPEHPAPVPGNDVVAALTWMRDNADALDIDTDRLALFGISSGATLIALAAQLAVDGLAPTVRAVVLQNPSVDLSDDASRFADPAEAAGAAALVAFYVGELDPGSAQVSPARRADLTGLAPHLVITAEWDALARDALRYATRMQSAGVDATSHHYPATHTLTTPEVFVRMHDETVAWLREHLSVAAHPHSSASANEAPFVRTTPIVTNEAEV